MGRRVSRAAQQDRALRITRLQSAIAELESHKNFFSRQGKLAPEGAWVARYQVKQPKKVPGVNYPLMRGENLVRGKLDFVGESNQ